MMKFHDFVYGGNIILDKTRTKATRLNDQCFGDGIVFSSKPIHNRLITVEIESRSTKWRGSLNVGLTSRDPVGFVKDGPLPKYAYPMGLCEEEQVWMKPLPTNLINSQISVLLNSSNQLMLIFNNEIRLPLFTNLPTDNFFWLIFDVYGKTTSLKFIEFEPDNEKIPASITYLGPEIVTAYQQACKYGAARYSTGHVFFIGAPQSGKSQLVQLLLTQSDENRKSKPEMCRSCFTDSKGHWQTEPLDSIFGYADTENSYQTMSYNIVKEIRAAKIKDGGDESFNTTEILKTAFRMANRKMNHFDDITDIDSNESDLIPPKLRDMIDHLLSKPNEFLNTENTENLDETANNRLQCNKYNLWDLKGDSIYLLFQQLFLNSQAVYVFVFNLNEELDTPIPNNNGPLQAEGHHTDYTQLDLLHFWLSLIYCHNTSQVYQASTVAPVASGESPTDDTPVIIKNLPNVILVGTHRNSLHNEPITRDQMIRDIFTRIDASLSGKPYQHVIDGNYIAIDSVHMSCNEMLIVDELRKKLDTTFNERNELDCLMPFEWIEFETIIDKLKKKSIHFADMSQLFELSRVHLNGIRMIENLQLIIRFHQLYGNAFFFPYNYHSIADSLVIIDPQWLVTCYMNLVDTIRTSTIDDQCRTGLLSEQCVNRAWKAYIEHKIILLGCLEKLDIVCELRPGLDLDEHSELSSSTHGHHSSHVTTRLYLFPWTTQLSNEAFDSVGLDFDVNPVNHLQLAIFFKGLLPIGLFSRLSVRLSRWSWNQGWGRRPEIGHAQCRLAVDFDHDLGIKAKIKTSRLLLTIIKIYETINNGGSHENTMHAPSPNVCVKVRHLLESELEIIQSTYYRRIVYLLEVPCPCDLICKEHHKPCCSEDSCLHFLPLQECLNKKVIECDYRQIRTNFVQKFFPQSPFYPSAIVNYFGQNYQIRTENQFMHEHIYDWENMFRIEPLWMRDAAKMLIGNNPGHDWLALAKRLGYNEKDVFKMVEQVSPSLALMHDWFESNGRTRYCIDVLMSCLKMISREDVRQMIEQDLEPIGGEPPIFISYQWDSQAIVLEIRRKLELAGFPCWMDIGLIGGGDSLYGKIYDGICHCRVVLCFLTPRYAASRLCARELTLADVLHKPILPIMIEQTPWPPPGPMAVIMSSLVFIDLCGVGGHGGIGKRGDSETKFRDILETVSRLISGHADHHIMMSRNPMIDERFYRQIPRLSISTINHETIGNRRVSEIIEDQQIEESLASENNLDENNSLTNVPQFVTSNVEESTSSDSISMISNIQNTNHRVSNCAICVIS